MSILLMDLNEGQSGLLCILRLKDLSTTGTIFQLYDTNLYCTATCGSTCFSYLFKLETERRNFSRENSIPIFGQRCIIPIFEQRTSRSFSFCGCFDLLEYDSDYRTWEVWTQMPLRCLAHKTCQPQQPSRQTIPLDFSRVWLRDTEKSAFVVTIFSIVREGYKPHQPVG